MTRALAIDPGDVESAFVMINSDDRFPIEIGKVANADLLAIISDRIERGMVDSIAIEMVASYGMPVGREVFETCVWIGRFLQHADGGRYRPPTRLVYRREVKLHHCHDSRAKDVNITAALVDRFAPGRPNRGKGTKADPGWFYGFAADVWQAYALAVYVADQAASYQP